MHKLRGSLRRAIVRAAPTCTLWRKGSNSMYYYFILYPDWRVTAGDYILAAGFAAFVRNF